MAPLGRPPVMLDIVEEHFEELDFLWELREGVIFAPDWNLDELAELEERAEAHLDGLRLAELHAVDVARPHLMGEHKFGATAATFVFMETGEEEFFAEVLKALVEAPPEARDGIRIGLRHSKIDAVEKRLFELAREGDPWVRAAAADVLAFHRRAMPEIRDLVDDDDAVRILVYGALGRCKEPIEPSLANEGLRAKTPEVRRAALEASACSGMPGLRPLCLEAATRSAEPDAESLRFLGVIGEPADLSVLLQSLGRPELAGAALRGLGALGRVAAIPHLLEAMARPETAAAAARAFRRITGAEVETTRPEPGDDFADDAPKPDPRKAAAWWDAHQNQFAPAARWQAGREVTPPVQRFDGLPLAVRRDLYQAERASRRPGLPDLELEQRVSIRSS